MMAPDPEKVGLPPTPFFYHLDQVATMLGFTMDQLIDTYVYFAGRTVGRFSPRQIMVRNVAVDESADPEWRISEGELIRWCRLLGFKVYSRGHII